MASLIPRCLSIGLISAATLFASTMASSAVAQSGRRSTSTPQYSSPQYRPANQGSTTQGSTTQGSTTQGSTTQGYTTQGSATQGSATQGSATHAGPDSRDLPVAMRGFCAVCLVNSKHWVRGNPEFRAAYDGKSYHFPDAKALQAFQAMPGKYAPALGGDDVVEFANSGRRVPGRLDFGVRHNDRIFFLSSVQNKQTFTAQPQNYEGIDLAAGGRCVVCQVEMNQSMPGRNEVAVVRNGIRYLFAGADQRKMFLASPAKYESAASPVPGGSGTQQGSGSSTHGSSTQGSGAHGSSTTQ